VRGVPFERRAGYLGYGGGLKSGAAAVEIEGPQERCVPGSANKSGSFQD